MHAGEVVTLHVADELVGTWLEADVQRPSAEAGFQGSDGPRLDGILVDGHAVTAERERARRADDDQLVIVRPRVVDIQRDVPGRNNGRGLDAKVPLAHMGRCATCTIV